MKATSRVEIESVQGTCRTNLTGRAVIRMQDPYHCYIWPTPWKATTGLPKNDDRGESGYGSQKLLPLLHKPRKVCRAERAQIGPCKPLHP